MAERTTGPSMQRATGPSRQRATGPSRQQTTGPSWDSGRLGLSPVAVDEARLRRLLPTGARRRGSTQPGPLSSPFFRATIEAVMDKVFTNATAALEGAVKNDMVVMAGGFGLCGIPENL